MPCLPVDSASKLFEPRAEIGDARRSDDRDLVAAGLAPARPVIVPSTTPGLSAGGTFAPQERTIICVAVEQPVDIEPITAAGTMPKSRQHRIAPADARDCRTRCAGNPSRSAIALQLRAGIGDGDEARAGLVGADRSPCARSKKYCLRMFGSSVLPDLLETMKSVLAGSILASIARICAGSVESSTSSFGIAILRAERLRQHFRAEARSAHAEKQDMGEASEPGRLARLQQIANALVLLLDDVEPAKPFCLVLAGPQAGVARPEPAHLAVVPPRFERRGDGFFQIRRQLVCLPVEPVAEKAARLSATAPSSLSKASAKRLHAVLDQFRRDRRRSRCRPCRALAIVCSAWSISSSRLSRALCRGRETHPSSRAEWC